MASVSQQNPAVRKEGLFFFFFFFFLKNEGRVASTLCLHFLGFLMYRCDATSVAKLRESENEEIYKEIYTGR